MYRCVHLPNSMGLECSSFLLAFQKLKELQSCLSFQFEHRIYQPNIILLVLEPYLWNRKFYILCISFLQVKSSRMFWPKKSLLKCSFGYINTHLSLMEKHNNYYLNSYNDSITLHPYDKVLFVIDGTKKLVHYITSFIFHSFLFRSTKFPFPFWYEDCFMFLHDVYHICWCSEVSTKINRVLSVGRKCN